MKIKKITTSVALAACLLTASSVGALAGSMHYGLNTGYAVGNVASTTVNGPVIGASFIVQKTKKWRAQANFDVTFLNGISSNSTLGSTGATPYLGEINIQVGYQVYPKLYTYGLLGVAGITSASSNNSGFEGYEWGAGASYDMYKYMSVYAQYTGQSLSTGLASMLTKCKIELIEKGENEAPKKDADDFNKLFSI